LDVCNAVYYAHQRGVLHRDLKPCNVMLGEYGETLVVDWGLAKPISQAKSSNKTTESLPPQESPLTPRSGSVIEETQQSFAIGTPHYMSPEQARGEHDKLGPAADVYSLGATLYTLLTNRKPVEGETLEEIFEKLQFGKRQTVREWNPWVDPALSAICERAMAIEAADRYGSVRRLANDVERFLADEPVEAYPEPLVRRTQRWIRKHPRIVGSLAATLVAGIVSAALIASVVASSNRTLGKKNIELEESREQAVQERDRAIEAEREAERKTRIANSTLDFLSKDLFLQLSAHEALQEWKRNPQPDDPEDDIFAGEFELDLPEDALEAERKDFAYEYADDLFLLSPAIVSQAFHEDPTVKRLSNMTLVEALDHAAKRIEIRFGNDPEVESQAHKIIGSAYASLNNLPKAIPELEKALASHREHLGDRHPDTLATAAKLGILQRMVGETAKAEKLLQEAAAGQNEVHGPTHYQTLSSQIYLANVYLDLGKPGSAEKLLFNSWEAIQKWDVSFERSLLTFTLFRSPYPSTLVPEVDLEKGVAPNEMQDIVTLALAQSMYRYFTLRREREEYALAVRAAETPLLKLGMNRGVIFDKGRNSFQRQLAFAYLELGKYDSAERQLEKVLHDIRIKQLPDHEDAQLLPELAWQSSDVHRLLGFCRVQHGKFKEAEQSLRRCLELLGKNSPKDWRTHQAKSLLGETLLGQEEYDSAETQ
ncbi:MAG: serine/threonine-protein kinase, partial [Lacipirellulaceae bacterium]